MEELLNSSNTPFLLISLLAFLLLIHFSITQSPRRLKTFSFLSRSPLSLPFIGHLHLLRPPLHQSLHRLTTLYGPIVHLRLGSTPAVLLGSPEAARDLMKFHDHSISDRPLSAVVRHFAYGTIGFAFAPYGPYWRFMKMLCMSELLCSRTIDGLAPIRRRQLLSLLRTLAVKSAAGESTDLSEELVKMTMSIMAGMTAGAASVANSEAARKSVKSVAELVGTPNLADFIWFFRGFDMQGINKRTKEVRDDFDALMERMITEKEAARRRSAESCKGGDINKDLLDILLDASESKEMEFQLTRENIKSFILDIFSAGSDSSASTTEWALAELINHPDMLQRAREEIDGAVGKHRVVEEADIARLHYLQAVVKETLRLHPAAPVVTRKSNTDIKLGDTEITKGSSIIINAYSLNRDPKYWEAPLEFRPDRFMEGDEGGVRYKGQHFHYLPFGSGRRICPGIGLAIPVVTTTLAALLQCFEWQVDGEGGKLDMSDGAGLVILRAKPLICFPKARLHPLPPELLN